MYSPELHVFIVRKYWRTGSFKQYQMTLWNKYGEGSVPTKILHSQIGEKIKRHPEVF
jgi:hypothetical protein